MPCGLEPWAALNFLASYGLEIITVLQIAHQLLQIFLGSGSLCTLIKEEEKEGLCVLKSLKHFLGLVYIKYRFVGFIGLAFAQKMTKFSE